MGCRTPRTDPASGASAVSGDDVNDDDNVSGRGVNDEDRIDERSQRWVTAVHEAGHLTVAEYYGARVASCRVLDDDTGTTRYKAGDAAHAVIAVAGERATRLLLGTGGGSTTDYTAAAAALARSDRATGIDHSIDRTEAQADVLIRAYRRDLLRTARHLYRTGGR